MLQDFQFKQAIIVRQDLRMGHGKVAVQCCHAAVSSAEAVRVRFRDWWNAWMREGQCKIVLKAKDLDTVLKLEREAKVAGLPSYLVQDRGLTQLEPGTVTCLGIGPAPSKSLDPITGDLRLL